MRLMRREPVYDLFLTRPYRGSVELTHLRTGWVVYGATRQEAIDQLEQVLEDAERAACRSSSPLTIIPPGAAKPAGSSSDQAITHMPSRSVSLRRVT
jgi:predicted metal-dependent phosphotriesterase family hydrolase